MKVVINSIVMGCLLQATSGVVLAKPGSSDLVVRKAVGKASGVDDFAKKQATVNAMAEAVRAECGQFVSAQTVVSNMAVIEDRIVESAEGYVVRHKVLRTWEAEGASFCEIEASVSHNRIGADLRTLLQLRGDPRVMVIAAEYVSGANGKSEGALNGTFQAALEGLLISKRVHLVDQQAAAEVVGRDADFEALAGKLQQVAARAAAINADILLYAKATADSLGPYETTLYDKKYTFYRWRLSMSVRAIRADTGEVVLSGTYAKKEVHKDMVSTCGEACFAELVKEVGPKLLQDIEIYVAQFPTTPQTINVVFENCSPDVFRDSIQSQLSRIDGISDVNVRQGVAETVNVDVRWLATSDVLADRIRKLPVDGFTFATSWQTAQRLIVTVSSDPATAQSRR